MLVRAVLVLLVLVLSASGAAAQPFLYVLGNSDQPAGGENRGPQFLTVVDTATNAKVKTLQLGQSCLCITGGLAITPDGRWVYASNSGDGTVSVVDTTTNTVAATIPGFGYVTSLAASPDGSKVYALDSGSAANSFARTIKAIDTATRVVTTGANLSMADAGGITVAPDGSRIYVANRSLSLGTFGESKVVSTATLAVIGSIPLRGENMDINRAGTRLYLMDGFSDKVHVIDTSSNQGIVTLDAAAVGRYPFRGRLTQDEARLYASHSLGNRVSIINTATNAFTGTTVSVSNPGDIAMTRDGARAYVTAAGAVVVINTATNAVTSTIPFASATEGSPNLLVMFPDADGDGLPDTLETQFGLNPLSATGNDGATGDPDGDGVGNLDEQRAGTHPRGVAAHARYFAEGATSDFFDLRLALLNPGATSAAVNLRFLRTEGLPVTHVLTVPAGSRRTLDPKTIGGLGRAEFSVALESDQALVVDRMMTWNAQGYGAHAETAVLQPAYTWYLAEGSTVGGFNLFYLLQNPNASETQVLVRYLRPSGAPIERSYTLPANSRTNIWVNQEDFPSLGKALASVDVSGVVQVTSGGPIIVERAMYLDRPGQAFAAGHESAGVTAPATEWFLAEGATGRFFDLFVLIANPGTSTADIEATYLLPDGTTIVKSYTVPGDSRFNIWVDFEAAALADTAVSTTLRSTNGVPVIVERAMWWPGTFTEWIEAHNSPGATATGARWALAEGEVGGSRNVDTYILVANTSATAAEVKVTLVYESGAPAERTFTVAPRSRYNIDVRAEFPGAVNRRFGAVVESLGASPSQLVVERAMYWDALGQTWAAGTNSLGTRLP